MSAVNCNLALEINLSNPELFKRDPGLLIPEQLLPRAEEFETAMNSFMGDAEYRLLELIGQRCVRLSRYEEDNDMVYSIVHNGAIHERPIPPGTLQATSIVSAEDGRTYGERHWFKTGQHSIRETSDGDVPVMAGIKHPLRLPEWHHQIIPITRALTAGRSLLKIVR